MRIKLKMMKMKIKKMSHLKRRTMIKGGDNDDQDKEDEQEVQGVILKIVYRECIVDLLISCAIFAS
jgi:hypothetical protein